MSRTWPFFSTRPLPQDGVLAPTLENKDALPQCLEFSEYYFEFNVRKWNCDDTGTLPFLDNRAWPTWIQHYRWWYVKVTGLPLTEEIRPEIFGTRNIGVSDRSFQWRALRLLSWRIIWNFRDSHDNVFDMYMEFCDFFGSRSDFKSDLLRPWIEPSTARCRAGVEIQSSRVYLHRNWVDCNRSQHLAPLLLHLNRIHFLCNL